MNLSITIFDEPTLFTFNQKNFLLISGGFGIIFLLQIDSNKKILFIGKYFLGKEKIVKSPVIVEELVFVLTSKGFILFN